MTASTAVTPLPHGATWHAAHTRDTRPATCGDTRTRPNKTNHAKQSGPTNHEKERQLSTDQHVQVSCQAEGEGGVAYLAVSRSPPVHGCSTCSNAPATHQCHGHVAGAPSRSAKVAALSVQPTPNTKATQARGPTCAARGSLCFDLPLSRSPRRSRQSPRRQAPAHSAGCTCRGARRAGRGWTLCAAWHDTTWPHTHTHVHTIHLDLFLPTAAVARPIRWRAKQHDAGSSARRK